MNDVKVRPKSMNPRVNKINMRYGALGVRFLSVAILVACGVGMAKIANCQTLYGSITGSVTDATGAVVAGATVTATQTETNQSRKGTTNGSGYYTLSSVPPGTYQILINKPGFDVFQTQNVDLRLNTVARIDAVLAVGTAKQSVTVSAQTAQLQTDRADVNAEVTSKDFVDLPQPTRTYQGLLGTVAGVPPPSDAGLQTNNVDRSMIIQANGTSGSATDVRIEGVSAAQPWVPFFSSITPSVEAIQTVSMVTASAESDQTLVSGATINVQLKSGTNNFHGELYEFHTDNLLKARPYFLPPGQPLPKNLDNDFGGTLGGPILRNKLFFFASYEGDLNRQSGVQTLTVPTAAMLAGDFSATNTIIYDPATGNPDGTGKVSFLAETGKNAIPASRLNQNIPPLLALVAKFPPTNSATANNYVSVLGLPENLHKIDTKVDWNATDKLRVTGRLNYHPYSLNLPANSFANTFDIGVPPKSYGHTWAVTLSTTYALSPHFLIDGSWGFTRSIEFIVPPLDNVKFGADTMHIPGLNLSDLPAGGGIPQFFVNGYTGMGYQYSYLNYDDPLFGYFGNATWTRGNHTIKFGVNINQQHMNHFETTPDRVSFAGNATTLNGGAQRNQFNSYADFLLGLPASWRNSFQPFKSSKLRSWQYSAYVTDSQQVTHNLTLGYGISWAYFPVSTHGSYGLENFNLDTHQYAVCGFGGIPKDCGIDTPKDLFSPHVGLAYRPSSTVVLRAGFSIATEQFIVGRDLMYNYPENIGYSASALSPYAPVGSLSDGVPTIPVPDYTQGVLPLPAGASFYALPQKLKYGYVESYNLTVQKEIGQWLAQIGYVGNQSIHQHMRYNINYGQVGGGVASAALYKLLGTSTEEDAILPIGHTNYNSLQATLQRRFANGFQLRSTYTYSKWLGLCCDTNGFGGLNTPIPQYQYLNYVVMPGDQRHIFNFTGIAELPFGRNKPYLQNGIGARALGGWQLNAVLTMFTGTPFGIGADGSSLNAPGSSQRADQIKPHVAIYGSKNEYFDVTAFAPVNQPRFGTAPYNSLYGPGARNLDTSIFRTFELPEHLSAQFRMEVFNTTNTPHFQDPGNDVSSVQYDGSGNITNLNGFGQITGTTTISRPVDERNVRFGVKLLF
jgi:hypothetical protein